MSRNKIKYALQILDGKKGRFFQKKPIAPKVSDDARKRNGAQSRRFMKKSRLGASL